MLWIHTVSKEISDSVDDTEKKRQEVINELIYTERDFVRDLEYLRDVSLEDLSFSTRPSNLFCFSEMDGTAQDWHHYSRVAA